MDALGWVELSNLLLLALLVGGEAGLLLGTHPALVRLPVPERENAMRLVCRRYGLALPVIALSAFATATAVTIGMMMANRPFWFGAIGWLGLGLALAILFRFLRPVNHQLATFPVNGQGWGALGRTWQLWHAAVALLAAVAFGFFVVAMAID